MQVAFFGLLVAILALKRPYLTLDRRVQRSTHEIGPSAAVWAADRLDDGRNRYFLPHCRETGNIQF